jgi:transposase-like protein
MQPNKFTQLLEIVGRLSARQVQDLRQRLNSLGLRHEALGAVESRSAAVVLCCGGAKMIRWGSTRTGFQRFRCSACGKTRSSATGTAVARVHRPELFQGLLTDMFSDNPSSCRSLSGTLGIDKMTAWRWRQKIIDALIGVGASELSGVVEVDEKYFRESRKGSREWVRYRRDPSLFIKPERPRWVDYKIHRQKLPSGISKFQIPVLTMADRAGAKRADVMPGQSAAPLIKTLGLRLTSDSVLCSDGDPAYALFARTNGLKHYRIDAKKGPFVLEAAFHIQNINSLHDRFERFMKPFIGPATKYLPRYTAWFIARSSGSKPERIEDAWDRLVAA